MGAFNLRLKFKRETGLYPDGTMDSMNRINIAFTHPELQRYIEWLEEEVLKLKKLQKSLIPWEK